MNVIDIMQYFTGDEPIFEELMIEPLKRKMKQPINDNKNI